MSEIVEANLFESEFFKKSDEMLGNIIRAYKLSRLIEANIIKVIPAIGAFK